MPVPKLKKAPHTTYAQADKLLENAMPELFVDTITLAQHKQRRQWAKTLCSSHEAKNDELIKLWKMMRDIQPKFNKRINLEPNENTTADSRAQSTYNETKKKAILSRMSQELVTLINTNMALPSCETLKLSRTIRVFIEKTTPMCI